jgi:hypothetical protein
MRWAIGFLFRSYFSTSKASPNDSEIVIVIIIVIGEAVEALHGDGIIAQRVHFGSAISGLKITPRAGEGSQTDVEILGSISKSLLKPRFIPPNGNFYEAKMSCYWPPGVIPA